MENAASSIEIRNAGDKRHDPGAGNFEAEAWVVQPVARTLQPLPGAPRLSAAACGLLQEIQILDEHGQGRLIQMPVERPLTVILDDRELVTLMTLGAAPELLVLGYLRNQRIVADARAIESITVDWEAGAAVVRSRRAGDDAPVAGGAAPGDDGAAPSDDGGAPGNDTAPGTGPVAASRWYAGMGCGLGTGFADLVTRSGTEVLAPAARVSQRTLLSVLDTMRQYDAIHRAAGSVHSCALFRGPDLWLSVEEVSRHNGLDTITGWMTLHGVAGGDKILFTTGRLSGEMVLKAAHNGVPIVVSRNGVTAMGHALAAQRGMTLFGRAANRRFLCYVGADRFDAEPAAE